MRDLNLEGEILIILSVSVTATNTKRNTNGEGFFSNKDWRSETKVRIEKRIRYSSIPHSQRWMVVYQYNSSVKYYGKG